MGKARGAIAKHTGKGGELRRRSKSFPRGDDVNQNKWLQNDTAAAMYAYRTSVI